LETPNSIPFGFPSKGGGERAKILLKKREFLKERIFLIVLDERGIPLVL
jgi:hypothetical protein